VRNNPLKYIDPSGHWTEEELEQFFGENWMQEYFGKGAVFEGRDKLLEMLQSKSTTGSLELSVIHDLMSIAWGLHAVGLSFSGIDAIGARVSLGGGLVTVGGSLGADAVLNIQAGQFSVFGSAEGGALFGVSGTIVGGVTLIKNLPTNDDLRRMYGAVGIYGGDVVGVNVEGFWSSPMSDRFDVTDKAHGGFIGVGPAVPEIAVYGMLGYSWEVLRVDQSGVVWAPYRPSLSEVMNDVSQSIVHDVLLHPIWPWSPYKE
jgi:hypothetical protein